ncbi:hypothetical protein QFC19_008554 [Naganishia cerealis]|uniref:Uncharacterized protein n=1 Tax=Naganishia cerealis TaxID=610337 RepID=A0ACC2V285_9TREE|nr:hypothetical protein QFC19_008554 [Naganishia cerealis]
MPSTIEERPTPAPCNDAKASVAANNAQATFRIVFQPAAKSPVPIRRASAPTVSKTMRNLAAAASADPQAQVDLIEALSNPLLYHRHAHLVAYLRSLIQSLETACAAVHAYARGEYMTEEPIKMALKRVAEAWTQMIVPLQLLNGPKIVEAKGNVPNRKDEEAKRKAVGRKLLEMAAEKQRCIDSSKPRSHTLPIDFGKPANSGERE